MTSQQKMTAKIAGCSTPSLMDMATALYADTREESGLVLSAVLDALMARMDEASFVNFCTKLEG